MATLSKQLFNIFLLLPFILSPLTAVFAQSTDSAPPDWLVHHWEFRTQNGGEWVADNSQYKTDSESSEAYVLKWKWGLGKKSITGRMHAISNGKETAPFWEYREFWHPGDQKAYVYQYGADGTIGFGEVKPAGEDSLEVKQQFFGPDGSNSPFGHRAINLPSGDQLITSYTISDNGNWEKNRSYVWKQKK